MADNIRQLITVYAEQWLQTSVQCHSRST